MDALPTGTVTFLFTDIEGSTQRWERYPGEMRPALRRHDEIVRAAIAAHQGHIFKALGDGFCAAFATAASAVAAAADLQQALSEQDWTAVDGLFVRVAIHSGNADERNGDYFGPALNRVARMLGLARGEQVLLSAATAALVTETLRDGESLLYLGRYRLVDLAEPEAVHQLLFTGARTSFSPLLAVDEPPHNLPATLTTYIESERVVEDVTDLVRQSRLLTLCGAGGVGKTRTALEVAYGMLQEWRDGVWFVQLESTSDTETIVRAIATALGVRDVARRTTSETLFEYLTPRRLLLVLDNCEHVIEAVAVFVNILLRRCRDINVLATSREPMRIAGERVFTVEPLPIPNFDPDQLPSTEELERCPSVKFFLDRARSVEPTFRFLEPHRGAVVQICARLDGIPLALELAASRIGAFSPRILADRLENRFALLTRGARGSLAHHRTLHALVDWSWSLLIEDERMLLRRLAIFAGGWTLEAAEAVTAGNGLETHAVFDLLDGLCEKSLVHKERGEFVRFRLLETIRVFAIEKLGDASERALIERSHTMYFAKLASEAEPLLRSASQHEAIGRITRDIDNFRAALDAVERETTLRDTGLALCAGLSRYWLLVGAFVEGRMRLETCTQSGDGNADMLVRILCGGSILALNARNLEEFVSTARRAAQIAKAAKDPWSIAFATICESAAFTLVPQVWSASEETTHRRARRLAAETADAWLLTFVEFLEARRAVDRGDDHAATVSEEKSLAYARASGDRFLLLTVALNLTIRLQGVDSPRAAALVIESTNALEGGNFAGLAACLECAVRLAVEFRHYDRAARLMGAATAFRESAGVPAVRIDANEYRALLIEALGFDRFERAFFVGRSLSFAEASCEIVDFGRDIPCPNVIRPALCQLGEIIDEFGPTIEDVDSE